MTTSTPPSIPAPLHIDPSRPVRVIDAAAPVSVALSTMRLAGVRHLPVVSRGRCTGLLVDRDVIAAAVDGVTLPVGRLARGPIPTVGPEDDARAVARSVLAGGLDAALVVVDGAVTGIVTATDALAAIAQPDPS
jgi:CBS domain-containing protein